MNIVLIGSRGSGKSAVGAALAQLLGRTAVSTDAEIERRVGCTIKNYVEKHGWDAFRDLESDIVHDLATRDDCILDTGGGVVLRQTNVDALRANARVFWLLAPVATLAARIQDDTNRPSLTGAKSFVDELAEVLAARTPLYAAAAHHVIDTAKRNPEAIAAAIAELFQRP
ncbi:MAG: shikimate kinase [Candidatus Hydrogenedentes bacterium]|nr:shikimate kinase [Candidatus Hydrogenedentota bacterium]